MKTRHAFMMFVLCFLFSGEASAQWFSAGDYVVVVEETPAMNGEKTVAKLSQGTNFRVNKVSNPYVSIAQEIDGKMISAWVRQKDVIKIGANHTALTAMRDNLTKTQGQQLGLPKGTAISILIQSDYPVDMFILTRTEGKAYFNILKNGGKGQIKVLASKFNVRLGTLEWRPPNDGQYVVVIDNTGFPKTGAHSGRTIHYSIAYCVDDPRPTKVQKGKGIIIGRATVDYDNFKGKNGREHQSFKILVDVIETIQKKKTSKILKTIEVVVDRDGYFFLENLSMEYRYVVKKFDFSKFDVPVPMTPVFGFGLLDEEKEKTKKIRVFRKPVAIGGLILSSACVEPSILDMGHVALQVNSKGTIRLRINSAHASIDNINGTLKVGFGGENSPLDRHDWFLKKFPKSEWSTTIRKDREGVYQERKESAKRKEEKKK